jgi:hypothetical protein
MIIVKSIAQLKKLAKNGRDFRIPLMGGLMVSRKNIRYDYRTKKFEVFNGIDGSVQLLSEDGLEAFSNIREAIRKGILIAE